MDVLGVVVLLLVAAAGWISSESIRARQREGRDPCREAAAQLGLLFQKEALKISGRMDGFEVSVELSSDSHGLDYVCERVVADGLGRIPKGLLLASTARWFPPDVWGKDVDVGDAEFCHRITARGPEGLLLAILNEATRARITELSLKHAGSIQKGWVSSQKRVFVEDAESLVSHIRELVDIARLVVIDDRDIATRLADHVLSERKKSVRLRNLSFLCAHFSRSPVCARTARRALDDRAAEVRLLAAKAIGPDANDGRSEGRFTCRRR